MKKRHLEAAVVNDSPLTSRDHPDPIGDVAVAVCRAILLLFDRREQLSDGRVIAVLSAAMVHLQEAMELLDAGRVLHRKTNSAGRRPS